MGEGRKPCRSLRFADAFRLRGRAAAATVLAAALLATPLRADDARPGEPAKPTGTRRALIVCGLPGDADHRALYAKAVESIRKALIERDGFAEADVWVRFGTESQSGDGPALSGSRGLSNREGIVSDVDELRKRITPEDSLWVIVLGHGHYDGRHSHLNLPGPDLSDVAFGKLFAGLKPREMVVMVTTSASGFFVKPLAAPGRVVIAATEADQEVNETVFPLALAEVLAAPPTDADYDKDGAFTVFDLYLAVVANVLKRYAADEELPTEHARLDDNGDGHGSELQQTFLPLEVLDPKAKVEEPSKKDKKKPEPKKADPVIGPKDDGAVASRIRVEPQTAADAASGTKQP